MPPRPGPDGKPVAPPPPPPGPPAPPRLRIWVIEREVMQELMTTGGLCDPSWSPDGKTFAAAGVRGVFTFTEPNFEPRVLVAGQLQAPPPGAPASREYRRSGVVAERRAPGVPIERRRRVALRGGRREERRGAAQARRTGQGAALGGRQDARSSTRRASPFRERRPPRNRACDDRASRPARVSRLDARPGRRHHGRLAHPRRLDDCPPTRPAAPSGTAS